MLDVTVTGLAETRVALQRVLPVATAHVRTAIDETAAANAASAKANVPVRSGRLKRAIAVLAARSGNNQVRARVGISDPVAAQYAAAVEFGTVKMAAHPFLDPAAHAEQTRHLQRLSDAGRAVESALKV